MQSLNVDIKASQQHKPQACAAWSYGGDFLTASCDVDIDECAINDFTQLLRFSHRVLCLAVTLAPLVVAQLGRKSKR
jgi:hypothetical protein